MSKHDIETIVMADSNFPISIIDKIIKDRFGGGLYDILSLLNLIELFSSDKEEAIKNWQIHELKELRRMHGTKNIIVFVPSTESNSRKIEADLKSDLRNIKINIVKYCTKDNIIEVNFEGKKECFPNNIINSICLICSDGRLIRIMSEYYKKFIGYDFNFRHICQPGTSAWATMSPASNDILESIKNHIERYKTKDLIIAHHGPDCGRFIQYHRIASHVDIDSERALKQHKENILRTCFKLEGFGRKLQRNNSDICLEHMVYYFEFNKENNILLVYVFMYHRDNNGPPQLINISCVEHKFDFSTYKFINDGNIIPKEEKTQVLALTS